MPGLVPDYKSHVVRRNSFHKLDELLKASGISRDMTSSSTFLPSLQASRAVAALAVVFCHACLFASRKSGQVLGDGWYHDGELGVDFFFVLSGVSIAHVHGSELGREERARMI